MASRVNKIAQSRKRRVLRVRKKLKGSSDKLRLCLTKSCKHIYAQLIDDITGKTVLGIGTASKSLKETSYSKKSREAAKYLGELIAKKAKEQKIENVVFDRGRYKYHGMFADFADAARNAGLKF
jgi:large subunit ribosomal protein L18